MDDANTSSWKHQRGSEYEKSQVPSRCTPRKLVAVNRHGFCKFVLLSYLFIFLVSSGYAVGER
jgi:hypothetical protein